MFRISEKCNLAFSPILLTLFENNFWLHIQNFMKMSKRKQTWTYDHNQLKKNYVVLHR